MPSPLARRLVAGASAGTIAAAAYAVEMAADVRAFHHNADDRLLLGRLVTRDPAAARRIGLAAHLGAGAMLGMAYTTIARPRLPGRGWLRGVLFAHAEFMSLYPLALLEDHHPGIREGTVGRYWTPVAFAQNVLRHVVFGVVLGELVDRLAPAEARP